MTYVNLGHWPRLTKLKKTLNNQKKNKNWTKSGQWLVIDRSIKGQWPIIEWSMTGYWPFLVIDQSSLTGQWSVIDRSLTGQWPVNMVIGRWSMTKITIKSGLNKLGKNQIFLSQNKVHHYILFWYKYHLSTIFTH